jgi:hypothetical protein
MRLEEIVNSGATQEQQVESDDLHRIAIASMQQSYTKLQRSKMAPGAASEREAPRLDDPFNGHLRGHLYSKYVDVDFTSDAASTK